MTTIANYYKYAALATASYVRMGNEPLTGQRFAEVAQEQDRLPQSIATELFNPADPEAPQPVPPEPTKLAAERFFAVLS